MAVCSVLDTLTNSVRSPPIYKTINIFESESNSAKPKSDNGDDIVRRMLILQHFATSLSKGKSSGGASSVLMIASDIGFCAT